MAHVKPGNHATGVIFFFFVRTNCLLTTVYSLATTVDGRARTTVDGPTSDTQVAAGDMSAHRPHGPRDSDLPHSLQRALPPCPQTHSPCSPSLAAEIVSSREVPV